MSDDQIVLLSTEIDAYVDALESFEVEDIGKARWHSQHEYIEKLNMQAILDANRNHHEYVRETMVNAEKMPILVSQLITTEIWREKIFRELLAMHFEPKVTFSVYLIFYHEACLVNLLETLMYHEDACTSLDDQIIDLIDYSYRLLTELIRKLKQEEQRTRQKQNNKDENPTRNFSENIKELLQQEETLRFDMGIKMLSIVRYITDCLEKLPISVTTRLLDNFDFVLLFVDYIELKPWQKTVENGTIMRHSEGKWQKISAEDRYIMPKIEGQVWLALYRLLMSPHCLQKYEYTEYNKNRITKLRAHLNDVILDQMPHLIQFQRFLEQLSFMEPPAVKKQLVLEQVAELYDRIHRKYKNQWKEIAEKQALTVLNPTEVEARQQATRWANTMNFDILETFLNEAPKCAMCGEQATKRCSRCQREWYCRRECQVKHWSKHKPLCQIVVEALKAEKEKLSE